MIALATHGYLTHMPRFKSARALYAIMTSLSERVNQEIYKHNGTTPVTWYQRLQTPVGDFVIENNAVVTMRANNADGQSTVTLGAGFSARAGSIFRAYVTRNYYCSPFQYRLANGGNTNPPNETQPARYILAKRIQQNEMYKMSANELIISYPNPTTGSIYYQLKSETNYEYSIADITGRNLETGTLSKNNNELNLNKLTSGIYLITIKNKQYTQTDKILLQ